jgi:hypothetical protein
MTAYPPANYSWNPQAYRPALIPRSVTAATPATPADQTRLADQEKRIVQLSDELVRVKRERNQALADLSMWTALGVTPDQVKAFRDQLAKLQAANQFLVRHNAELQVKLSWFVGVEKEVQMPGDLAGRVLRVDPKYGFVVLNIGEKQGVAKNGRLLIKRESKLVGKVRVSTVDPDTSIANIMPDWKLAEVMEGDQVIHQ